MTFFRAALSVAPAALAMCAPASAVHAAPRASVRVELISFRGWSDAYRVSNGTVELVAEPGIGRILDFQLAGHPNSNPIWVNSALAGHGLSGLSSDWANFGGEKVWPSPQGDWPARQHQKGDWPSDRQFECGPFTVSRIPNGLRLTGPLVKNYGLRVVREITMEPRGASVHLTQRFVKSAGAADAFRVGVWSIAQVRPDAVVTIPLNPRSVFPRGYTALTAGAHGDPNWRVAGRALAVSHSSVVDNKVGVDNSAGWFSARYPSGRSEDTLFRIQFHSKTQGAYPDHGSSTEVYNRSDPTVPYLEMEALTPMTILKPGQSMEQDIIWSLRTVRRGARR